MIPLADVWDYRSKWCKEFADNWERESYDLEGIYSYRLATMKKACPELLPDLLLFSNKNISLLIGKHP